MRRQISSKRLLLCDQASRPAQPFPPHGLSQLGCSGSVGGTTLPSTRPRR
jgi:hypothetical protein